jgi:hypothetical protein
MSAGLLLEIKIRCRNAWFAIDALMVQKVGTWLSKRIAAQSGQELI